LQEIASQILEIRSLRKPGFSVYPILKRKKGSDNMKRFWMVAIAAGVFTASAIAQTSASSSASGNASVSPGQASAGASTSQNAQAAGSGANVDASANAKASHEKESKKQTDAKGGANSNTSAAGHGASGVLSSGTTLQAELTKSVDAKKAKSGDEVTAKLAQDVKSDGKVVLHKGSKLVGHVTEAQAKSKENAESKLGIVFDKAILKGGEEVAFSGVIQALAPPVQGTASIAGDESSSLGSGMGSGGSSMGGARSSGAGGVVAPIGGATSAASSTLGSATNAAGNTVGSVAGSAGGTVNRAGAVAANGTLTSAAHGAIGMQGMVLNPAVAGSAQGSVISSARNNVKLDSGTQLVLQVAGSAAAQ
jgi:hypothetical protein